MKRHYGLGLILVASVTLTGCGSLLASMGSSRFEDNPVQRTLGQRLEDEAIETKAMVNVRAASEDFDRAHLVIVSYNGYVLLAGQVPDQPLKARAVEIIKQIRGVRRIYNELEVAAASSALTRTSDTWITAKVKSWLLGSPETPGSRIKVVTENGVVYLMGLTTAVEAERVANVAAELRGVQRVVRLFEVVK